MLTFAADSSLLISPELTVEELVAQAFDRLAPRVATRLHEHRQELDRKQRVTTEDEFYCIRYEALIEQRQGGPAEDEPGISPELAALESRAIQQDIFALERGVRKLPRRR